MSLPSITLPDSVINLGYRAFQLCGNLTNVTLGNGLGKIADSTFYSCIELNHVNIGANVGMIVNLAFDECPNLNYIVIPGGVTNLGRFAFHQCTNLTTIAVDSSNPVYSSVDGVLFDKTTNTLILCPEGKTGSYNVPDVAKTLGTSAFDSCVRLTNVVIGTNVTALGTNTFRNCVSLDNVVIPDSIKFIPVQAFWDCAGLRKVLIPASVTNIGPGAFDSCMSLTNVTIPGNVLKVESYAFNSCNGLRGVFFRGNAPKTNSNVFAGVNNAIVYYLLGTTNWSSVFAGLPTALWNPTMQTGDSSFGVGPSGFGFNIAGSTNIPIVVEASMNLLGASWTALQNCNLTNGTVFFSDPQWTNYPARFYRLRWP